MSDKEIGSLTGASALDGTETIHCVQGGNSRKATVAQIRTFAQWALAGSWTFSTNVASVNFTGLDNYSEVLCIAKGLTCSASAGRVMNFSTDGGTTWLGPTSGDLVAVDANGAETSASSPSFNATNASTAISGSMLFSLFNSSGHRKRIIIENRAVVRLTSTTSPLNAVQLAASTGNLTGGSFEVWGR